jgi:hypothetical protein
MMAKGGKIVGYEVEYEKLVDGERERDIKSFKTKEDAEAFAKENYGYVDNVYEGQYEMADGGMMAYGGFIDKSEMNKREQDSYSKAVMKGVSIVSSDGITFSTRSENRAVNLAKSFADIGYDTKVVTIGGGENYVVWVKKTYADGGMMAKGGTTQENLLKELNKLQRDLNSSRLQTYREGDTSEEAMSRQREREVKLKRFNEVLETLRESEKMADGGMMAKGGVSFDEKVDSISKSLLKRKKVSPKVQKDYGKTYSKKESQTAAKRIAGSMLAKYKKK